MRYTRGRRTLEMEGTSKAGTPSLPRLPKPAVDPQAAASATPAPNSSFSVLLGMALEELLDAKRVANVFMAEERGEETRVEGFD